MSALSITVDADVVDPRAKLATTDQQAIEEALFERALLEVAAVFPELTATEDGQRKLRLLARRSIGWDQDDWRARMWKKHMKRN